MNPLYNAGIRLYALAASVASLRNRKARLMVDGQRKTLENIERKLGRDSRPVWVHASSLGEFEQGRPLIEKLRREHPGRKILLTFFSPSGYEVRRNYAGADCVAYLPFDKPSNVRRFLDLVNPSVAVFVKYEFWGNYLQQLRRRGVPTYLISAIFRPGQVFFRPWGGMFRSMLRCYTHIFVQDERSRQLLASVGVDCVTVAGDTRFDRVTDICRTTVALEPVERFCGGVRRPGRLPVMIAGSSWGPDEEAYLPWVNSRDDIRLIIAPHEFDAQRIARITAQVEGRCVLYSEAERDITAVDGAKCMIVDCFGKLSSIYRYGDIAYIGGGFGTGIHNINEAAVYGMPVVFGPRHAKFKEASDLIAEGGGFEIDSPESCAAVLGALADNPEHLADASSRAAAYIRRNLGATDKVYATIFPG